MQSTAHSDKANVIAEACSALSGDDPIRAGEIVEAGYPFVATTRVSRRYTDRQSLQVFYRDGFIDRYSGDRLVHPGALRLLSILLPDQFPAHPNWDMTQTHLGFWELFPSIDHVVPVARGGTDDESNWVTTSMLRNSAKGHWTLDELGWSMVRAGDATAWDGLSGWYVDYLTHHQQLQDSVPYLRRWFSATVALQAQESAVRPGPESGSGSQPIRTQSPTAHPPSAT